MDAGILGGLLGALIGVLGGAFGTWCSLRGARGPRERGFLARAAAATWIAVLAFVAALLLLPPPWKWLLWVPYAFALPLGIQIINRRHARIRQQESRAS
jgi:hypothetical protein